PTAMLADYVFPTTGPTERPICTTPGVGDSSNVIFGSERVVKPPYERRDDYQFWCGLGRRMGQKEYWPWPTLEEVNDHRLKPLGMTFADFARKPWIIPPPTYKRYERTGFATPSGKVEIYSSIFEKLGGDPIPFYEEPAESPVSTPELAREYPLILTTGRRFEEAMHSNYRHIQVLRKAHPDPLAEIHPETAAAMEPPVSDGDWIWVETLRGKAKFRAMVTTDILPGVVQAEHDWWFPERQGEEPELFGMWESNINVCTSDEPEHCDKLIGSWYYRGMLCKVYKA
ncbi:molybdopterin dinucleotide binding domain-containing protein, partial [Chloroflexota bacterium]